MKRLSDVSAAERRDRWAAVICCTQEGEDRRALYIQFAKAEHEEYNELRRRRGLPPIPFRMGD